MVPGLSSLPASPQPSLCRLPEVHSETWPPLLHHRSLYRLRQSAAFHHNELLHCSLHAEWIVCRSQVLVDCCRYWRSCIRGPNSATVLPKLSWKFDFVIVLWISRVTFWVQKLPSGGILSFSYENYEFVMRLLSVNMLDTTILHQPKLYSWILIVCRLRRLLSSLTACLGVIASCRRDLLKEMKFHLSADVYECYTFFVSSLVTASVWRWE